MPVLIAPSLNPRGLRSEYKSEYLGNIAAGELFFAR